MRLKPREFDWRDTLKAGDMLLTPSRDLRAVRKVRYGPDGFLKTVIFAIRHCSWTGRAYTVYQRTDLKTLGYVKAGVRARLDRPMDKMLDQCLTYENRFDQCLTCKDAKVLA